MIRRLLMWALPLFPVLALGPNADARQAADLRDLSLGMSIANISAEEYVGLACADEEGAKLAAWSEFRMCPADEMGLRAISFRFNNEINPLAAVNDKYEGTKLGGHPVLLTGLVDRSGVLKRIRIDTDPNARPFWHKKAHLLALIVRARYGDDGWICRDTERHEGETSVGGLLIKERCEKRSERRRLVLYREVYRRAGQPLSDVVNATHFIIDQAMDR
ncbi:hypothetical protein GA0061098_105417 [Bradyrhizobium shewense]|uniref:Uncharacterized protein n=1 Tax=Bradyrhizobium shewense TaxID=1761772 RepID=A0A1C3XUV1_9BRAD|nr:hypothetical protein [Bradyrhizobium shewense]SCB55796.1 hypothetical protein GA0061098_105417 [Bradyrhizobium shewense]